YFQFVFAAITPLLFLGSVIGRISFKVWLIFVPLWSTFAYAVNAFLLWGGGWWAAHGALDFSGGGWVRQGGGGVGGLGGGGVGGGERAAAEAGPVPWRAQQPAAGLGGRGHPVAGLERVQRR